MSYIYSPAKNRRSGSTMQKMPLRGSLSRWEKAREVRPGYPVESPFTCRAAVDSYLSGSEVTCLLCGKEYKFLGPHIKRVHHIDSGDYKEKYGIPQNRGLGAEETLRSPKKLEQAQRLSKEYPGTYEVRQKSLGVPQRVKPSFIRDEMAQRINAPDIDRHTYHDFTWHIETAAKSHEYTMIAPPEGHASWSAFKKRRNKDPALKAAFKAARRAAP